MSSIKQFMNKNLVAIVMVPSLIMIHVVWNNLQNVESLVSKAEKKDLPIVIIVSIEVKGINNKFIKLNFRLRSC